MSAFTFLVEVGVERESGKFASRDEIAERLAEAIADGVDNVSLDSLGADSESTYTADGVDVSLVEKKDQKAINAEYDAAVVAELPGDAELRAEVKRLKKELAQAQFDVANAKTKIASLLEVQEQTKTRIYQYTDRSTDRDLKTYLRDGQYDRVYFQSGDQDHHRWEVRLEDDGQLTVRTETFDGDMVCVPRSANEVQFRIVNREARR